MSKKLLEEAHNFLSTALDTYTSGRKIVINLIDRINKLQKTNKLLYDALLALKSDECWCSMIQGPEMRPIGHHHSICCKASNAAWTNRKDQES